MDKDPSAIRALGWGRFLLQAATVGLVYLVASAPPVLLLGMDNGLMPSVVASMAAALAVAWFWLKRDGALGAAWQMRSSHSAGRQAALAAFGIFGVFFIFSVGGFVLDTLGLPQADVSMVMERVVESPTSLVLWIVVVSCFTAGLGEELLFRGFLMDRLARLPGLQGSVAGPVVLQGAIFGLLHLYQGPGGYIVTATVGVFLGWLRIANRGGLWPLVIAHAAVNSISMLLAFASHSGWIAVPQTG